MGLIFRSGCTGGAGSVPSCVSGLSIARAPLRHGVGGGVRCLDAETKCSCSCRAPAPWLLQVGLSPLSCAWRRWTPGMVCCLQAGGSAWFLFRGLVVLLYLLCLGFRLSLCRREERHKLRGAWGGITNRGEPSSGRERPGRSRGEPSTAPAPRRADPARILHVSFPFFFFFKFSSLPSGFIFSPSISLLLFPPSLPSLSP